MGGADLADQLTQDRVEIPAGHGALNQRAVQLAHGLPIDTVQIRVIEEVAVGTPDIVEDLPPLGARLDGHLQIGIELLLEPLPRAHIDDVETAARHQHLLAVGGDRVVACPLDDHLLFARLQVPGNDRRGLAGAAARQAREQHLAGHGAKPTVVTGLRRQHNDAALQPLDVDLQSFVLLLIVLVGRLVRRLVILSARFGGVAFVLGRRHAILVLDLFVVVAWRQRRGHIGAQRHGHDVGGVGIHPGGIEVGVDRPQGAIRQVVEVVAVGVKARPEVAVVARGHLVPLTGTGVVEEDRPLGGIEGPRVGEPVTVGRPAHLEARQLRVQLPARRVDLGELPGFHIEYADYLA